MTCTKNKINESNIKENELSFQINNSFSNSTSISSSPNKKYKRRTNRGRRPLFILPMNIPKCEVCLEYCNLSKEKLIFCTVCKCNFHKSCYDQYEEINQTNEEDKKYKCIRCIEATKLNKLIYEIKCFICNESNGVLKYNKYKEFYYHQICLDNLTELNDLKEEEITKDFIKKWRYKNSCRYCGYKLSKLIAVIKCKKPKCKEYYHLPCAIQKGLIFSLNFMKQFYKVNKNNQIPFYCSKHNKKISNQYKAYINKYQNKEIKLKTEHKEKTFPGKKENTDEKIQEYKRENDNSNDIFKGNGNKEKNLMVEYKLEENKENIKCVNLQDNYYSDNSNEKIVQLYLDKELNFGINKPSFNYNGLESNNGIINYSFNTKMHDVYKKGGLIIQKNPSCDFYYFDRCLNMGEY